MLMDSPQHEHNHRGSLCAMPPSCSFCVLHLAGSCHVMVEAGSQLGLTFFYKCVPCAQAFVLIQGLLCPSWKPPLSPDSILLPSNSPAMLLAECSSCVPNLAMDLLNSLHPL